MPGGPIQAGSAETNAPRTVAPAKLASGAGARPCLLLGFERFAMLTGAAEKRHPIWRPWAAGYVRLPPRRARSSGGEPVAADFRFAPCVGVGRTQMRGAPVPPAPPNPDRRSLSASSSRSPSQPPSCDPPRLQGEHHIPVDPRCCGSLGPSSSNPQNVGGH